jgi:hypothetical protein
VTAALASEIPSDLAVDEIVFKPFELDELLERLSEIVASGRPLKRAGT